MSKYSILLSLIFLSLFFTNIQIQVGAIDNTDPDISTRISQFGDMSVEIKENDTYISIKLKTEIWNSNKDEVKVDIWSNCRTKIRINITFRNLVLNYQDSFCYYSPSTTAITKINPGITNFDLNAELIIYEYQSLDLPDGNYSLYFDFGQPPQNIYYSYIVATNGIYEYSSQEIHTNWGEATNGNEEVNFVPLGLISLSIMLVYILQRKVKTN